MVLCIVPATLKTKQMSSAWKYHNNVVTAPLTNNSHHLTTGACYTLHCQAFRTSDENISRSISKMVLINSLVAFGNMLKGT